MIDLDITGADPKDVEEYVAINEESQHHRMGVNQK